MYRPRPRRLWLLVLLILIGPAIVVPMGYAADGLTNRAGMLVYGLTAGLLWTQLLLIASIALLHNGPALIRLIAFLGGATFAVTVVSLTANPFDAGDTSVAIVGNAAALFLPLLAFPLFLCVARYRWVLAAADADASPRPTSIKTLMSAVALVALYLTALRAAPSLLASAVPVDEWLIYAALFSPLALGAGVIVTLMLPESLRYRGLPRRRVRWIASAGAAGASSAASIAVYGLWCSPSSRAEVAEYAGMPLAMLTTCWVVVLASGTLLRRGNYRLIGRSQGDFAHEVSDRSTIGCVSAAASVADTQVRSQISDCIAFRYPAPSSNP